MPGCGLESGAGNKLSRRCRPASEDTCASSQSRLWNSEQPERSRAGDDDRRRQRDAVEADHLRRLPELSADPEDLEGIGDAFAAAEGRESGGPVGWISPTSTASPAVDRRRAGEAIDQRCTFAPRRHRGHQQVRARSNRRRHRAARPATVSCGANPYARSNPNAMAPAIAASPSSDSRTMDCTPFTAPSSLRHYTDSRLTFVRRR